jgi:hypothetical protein
LVKETPELVFCYSRPGSWPLCQLANIRQDWAKLNSGLSVRTFRNRHFPGPVVTVAQVQAADQVVHLTRLLHRESFQMVTAIQQPGHCLWRVRKPLSPQVPDE